MSPMIKSIFFRKKPLICQELRLMARLLPYLPGAHCFGMVMFLWETSGSAMDSGHWWFWHGDSRGHLLLRWCFHYPLKTGEADQDFGRVQVRLTGNLCHAVEKKSNPYMFLSNRLKSWNETSLPLVFWQFAIENPPMLWAIGGPIGFHWIADSTILPKGGPFWDTAMVSMPLDEGYITYIYIDIYIHIGIYICI